MPVRIAIVGHGRVGSAFARGFAGAGAAVLGFLGRDADRARAAAVAAGVGDALTPRDLRRAHC
ncbi:MAG: NAD(P)-binding domain-containing protein, partial [Planctomycetota bacterium]